MFNSYIELSSYCIYKTCWTFEQEKQFVSVFLAKNKKSILHQQKVLYSAKNFQFYTNLSLCYFYKQQNIPSSQNLDSTFRNFNYS